MALYGALVAALGYAVLAGAVPAGSEWPFYRSTDPLTGSLEAMDEGSPPLVERNLALDRAGPYDGVPPEADLDALTRAVELGAGERAPAERGGLGRGLGEQQPAPADAPPWQVINYGGAFGIFVFAPIVGHAFDLTGPEAMRVMFLALFTLAIALYPLIFFAATRSIAAAVVAPLALIVALHQIDFAADSYWAQAWAAILLIPAVWVLATRPRWGWRAAALVVAIGVAASFATSLRDFAALGVVIAAAGVIVLRRSAPPLHRAGLVALLAAAYLSVTPVLIGAVEDNARDWAEQNGGVAQVPETPRSFFWHSAYIGIGWLPNDEGLVYSDNVGYLRARQQDPDVYPFTSDYLSIMRDLFEDEVTSEPLEYAALEAKKLTAVLDDHSRQLLVLTVVLPLALLIRGTRRGALTSGLLCVPAALVGLAQGLVAIPAAHYVFGFNGALVAWTAMLLAILVAQAERSVRLHRSSGERLLPAIHRPVASVVAAATLLSLWITGQALGIGYKNQSTEWALTAPVSASIARANALGSATLEEDRDLAYELGARGPGAALPDALELKGARGIVSSSYEPFAPGSARSFEGWVSRDDPAAPATLFSSSSQLRSPILRVNGNGDVDFFSAAGALVTWESAWPAGEEWVHWVLNRDDSTGATELFLNGRSAGVRTLDQPYAGDAGTFQIGAWGLGRSEPLAGRIAGVAVYDRLLTPDEVEAHRRAASGEEDYGEVVGRDGPSVLWPLDERSGIVVEDAAGDEDGEIVWYG